MKIVVTGTRGIPNIMGGVETHCEELFPRMVERGYDVTLIRRSNYVKDDLHEWKGVKLVTIPSPKKKSFEAIIHTFRAINEAKKLGADVLQGQSFRPVNRVNDQSLADCRISLDKCDVIHEHGPACRLVSPCHIHVIRRAFRVNKERIGKLSCQTRLANPLWTIDDNTLGPCPFTFCNLH